MVEVLERGLQMTVVPRADLDGPGVRILRLYVVMGDESSASSAVSSEEERDDTVTVAWEIPPVLGVVDLSMRHRSSPPGMLITRTAHRPAWSWLLNHSFMASIDPSLSVR